MSWKKLLIIFDNKPLKLFYKLNVYKISAKEHQVVHS